MKKIIITGGNHGLGLEISKILLDHDIEVICLSRSEPILPIKWIYTDLTDKISITSTTKEIQENYSDFLCIICCAGIGYIEGLNDIDYQHTEEMFKVNITGQNYLLSKLSEKIKYNNADIMFIGATIGYKGNDFMPMYSVTKRGLRGLIENRRNILKNTSCRVIGVHPGGMNTESNIGPEGRERVIANITGKAIGTLLDASKVANFIYSLLQLPKNMEISEVIINRK